jgi:hypothetical protein
MAGIYGRLRTTRRRRKLRGDRIRFLQGAKPQRVAKTGINCPFRLVGRV